MLTLIGDDRPGLVSAVSGPVEARGGTWQRSQLARLAGKFAGIVLVSVPERAVAGLEQDLAALAGEGLFVTVTQVGSSGTPAAGTPGTGATGTGTTARVAAWSLHLVGQDRPGIVAEVSAILARHGVGIDELQTDVLDAPMAGGTLFEASARLSLSPGVDPHRVQAELEQLAHELIVDLDVHPAAD